MNQIGADGSSDPRNVKILLAFLSKDTPGCIHIKRIYNIIKRIKYQHKLEAKVTFLHTDVLEAFSSLPK
jgi:hypothetical protein